MSMDLSATLFDGCDVGCASNGRLLWDHCLAPEERDQLIAACRAGEDVLHIYGSPTPPETLLRYVDGTDGYSMAEELSDDQLVEVMRGHGWIDTVGDADYLRRRRK